MTTETMKSATRDGVTLRYIEAGTGDPAIVFAHGWCCDSSHWRHQLPHFATRHRVVALDQRGHGASDQPDEDYTIGGFAEDLAWLSAELGLERPVIVGHSMGGSVALNFAHKYPDSTRGVVLVDSPIMPMPEAVKPLVDQTLAALQSPAYVGVAQGFARMQFFNADSPPALIEEVAAGIATASQRMTHTAIASALNPESMPAGAIPVRVLYIRASMAYMSEDDLRGRYPGMQVVTVPSAHFVQIEHPDETNALIEQFLTELA